MKNRSKAAKIIVALALAISLMPLMAAPASASSGFSDVPQAHIAHDAIQWAQANGLVTGSGGRFNPSGNMSRAAFALVLWRYAGQPAPDSNVGFSDVPRGHVAHAAIQWAQANGIVTGSGGRFNPTGSVSNAAVALMLYRYHVGVNGGARVQGTSALDGFPDRGSVPPAAREAVAWAVENGLMAGTGGRLLPTGPSTRAALVLALHGYETGVRPTGPGGGPDGGGHDAAPNNPSIVIERGADGIRRWPDGTPVSGSRQHWVDSEGRTFVADDRVPPGRVGRVVYTDTPLNPSLMERTADGRPIGPDGAYNGFSAWFRVCNCGAEFSAAQNKIAGEHQSAHLLAGEPSAWRGEQRIVGWIYLEPEP